MKIRELSQEYRVLFKKQIPIYMDFFKQSAPQLSSHSHQMYSRALSYIAVENTLFNKSPKELAVELSKHILTTSDFVKIVGKDTEANQNIRLSAFRNLVKPYKHDLQSEISSVSYETLSKLVSQKGTHIRKNILESKSCNLAEETDLLKNRSWKALQGILQEFNKKYKVIVNRFLRTNEIPDYVTLRNICLANLYLNNCHLFEEITTHVILRNEYRTVHLWINGNSPPQDKNNYFWINFEKNEHYIVIQSSKTVGGVRRTSSKESAYYEQDKRRKFPLSNTLVNMILFIKQTFNERTDAPFFKNNTRDGSLTAQAYVRVISKIFEEICQNMTTSTLRKIYFNEIKWDKLNKSQRTYVCQMLDNSALERDIRLKPNETPTYNLESPSDVCPSPASSESGVIVF